MVAFNPFSDIPELSYLTNKEAASLIGVAPFNKESGSYEGQRNISGGHHKIRTVMYMAMMSTIIACVRKMVIILNSMLKDGVIWDPKMNSN